MGKIKLKSANRLIFIYSMPLNQVWNFLNQNIISEAIGAMFFGLIATYLFYRFSRRQELKELKIKITEKLKKEISENKNIIEQILTSFNNQTILVDPLPLKVSVLSAIINGKFIDVFSPKQVFLIFELSEEVNKANRLYEELFNKYCSVDAALGGMEIIRNSIKDYLSKMLPNIKNLCDELLKELNK